VQAGWFARWLKDRPLEHPEALLFDGGAFRWRTFDRWPSPDAVARRLYFRSGGLLSFEPPSDRDQKEAPFDAYLSDPDHPVPYRLRPVEETYDPRGSGWYSWLSEDQRFVDDRPDVLTWSTPPLEADVTVAGDVAAHLFASTTGSDADWVVKLIDVFPDSMPEAELGGYQFMVSADILRGRYRTSFATAKPIIPNRVAEYVVRMNQQLYTFKRGHRIMVQVQSTWFPLYDRNPQTFVPNIFHARPSDFRARTHRIWRDPAHPSHVRVAVVPGSSAGTTPQ
jgi:putative CocE/NonD family hydrolase